MEKNTVFGELLYMGFVCEKGQCRSSGLWKYGYKKILFKHVSILKKILICMSDQKVTDEDVRVLKCFVNTLEEENEIGDYYPISASIFAQLKEADFKIITYVDSAKENKEVNRLMILLIDDLLDCLSKKRVIDKKYIHMLLRSLHNLPRVYLDKSLNTLYNIGFSISSITSDEAFEYTLFNMNDEAKNKYYRFFPNDKA